MIHSHIGEFAAILTALFWTVTALSFEAASKRIGSLAVNLLRLIVGFVFLSVFTWFYRGFLFPADATRDNWLWLMLSGLIGFVFGDLCLFQAFVVIGARVSMTGIAVVVITRDVRGGEIRNVVPLRFNFPIWGLLLAFGGAFGQSLGLVLSKLGMAGYDPFASSQIRVLAGIFGFSVIVTVMKQWRDLGASLKLSRPMMQLSLGAFFGPFLGVSFSLLAVQYANMGVAATLMAIVPILIIPPSMLINKERVTAKEIIGAIVAVTGVAMLFM
jgi:drug/metabolite transporter (DMT)-like permease